MYPYALSINYPLRSARYHGYSGKIIMRRQPGSKTEAIHWASGISKRLYRLSRSRSGERRNGRQIPYQADGALRAMREPGRWSQNSD